jgi:pimeloyl-ACP methyl ester carboxylesterase
MVYFQKPGVAEAEFEKDVRRSILTIHSMLSGDAPEGIFMRSRPSSEKFLDGLEEPEALPKAMTQEDLDYFVEQYQRSGFRGGLNWYRNIDRSMELTSELEGRKIVQPSLFIAGERDVVLKFPGMDPETVFEPLADLRGMHIIPGAGHWVPAERPNEVNAILLPFLQSLE